MAEWKEANKIEMQGGCMNYEGEKGERGEEARRMGERLEGKETGRKGGRKYDGEVVWTAGDS